MRIAMWSGPRNLSTAMMYSFGNRTDCAVWDEPFYAAYLAKTGLNHPMRREILAAGETDPALVAKRCSGDAPEGKPLFYQKHMTHHQLPDFPQDWLSGMTHVFLIRDPARVIASYQAKRENPTLDDIGFRQQAEIYARVGAGAVVLDSDDLLRAPEAALRALCEAIDIPFQPAMLHWPKGGHKDDGAWAPHWYGAVWQSEGFSSTPSSLPQLSEQNEALRAKAAPYFQALSTDKLTF